MRTQGCQARVPNDQWVAGVGVDSKRSKARQCGIAPLGAPGVGRPARRDASGAGVPVLIPWTRWFGSTGCLSVEGGAPSCWSHSSPDYLLHSSLHEPKAVLVSVLSVWLQGRRFFQCNAGLKQDSWSAHSGTSAERALRCQLTRYLSRMLAHTNLLTSFTLSHRSRTHSKTWNQLANNSLYYSESYTL